MSHQTPGWYTRAKLLALLALSSGSRYTQAHAWSWDALRPEISLSLPQPILLGVEVPERFFTEEASEFTHSWRLYLDGGYFRLPFSTREREIQLWSLEAGLRAAPWASWVHLALGVGLRRFVVSANTRAFVSQGEILATQGRLGVSALYLSPQIEFGGEISSHLSLYCGIGLQVVIVGGASLSLVNEETKTHSGNSPVLYTGDSRALNRLSQILLPRLTLIRLQYRFE